MTKSNGLNHFFFKYYCSLDITPLHLSESSSYNSNPHCNQITSTGAETTVIHREPTLTESYSMRRNHLLHRTRRVRRRRALSQSMGAEKHQSLPIDCRPQTRRGMLKSNRLHLESDDSSEVRIKLTT